MSDQDILERPELLRVRDLDLMEEELFKERFLGCLGAVCLVTEAFTVLEEIGEDILKCGSDAYGADPKE
jgi:hypothetical protein